MSVDRQQVTGKLKIVLRIPGPPVAKARPKFCRRGAHVSTYKPKPQEEAEWRFISVVQNQLRRYGELIPVAKGFPLAVTCRFLMPIPPSSTKKFKAQCTEGTVFHTKKPDADNLVKFVKDCCNRLVWHDDSQVAVIVGTKFYALEPGTIVEIEMLGVA